MTDKLNLALSLTVLYLPVSPICLTVPRCIPNISFYELYLTIPHLPCRPSGYNVSEDAEIEPRTVATFALTPRRSNYSAKSHPQLGHISHNHFFVLKSTLSIHILGTHGSLKVHLHEIFFPKRDPGAEG